MRGWNWLGGLADRDVSNRLLVTLSTLFGVIGIGMPRLSAALLATLLIGFAWFTDAVRPDQSNEIEEELEEDLEEWLEDEQGT